ncbi:MAG TPA: DUF4388 domain-containing protein [Myxococcota bacterium]|nr:DUF4388 domain-containing protein [Myxococcota bacterium]
MSLVGSLEDLGLGDILQIVSLSRKSGLLRIRSEHGEGRVVFCDGLVRAAYVKGEPEDLRSLLVGSNFIRAEEFDRAVDRASARGVRVDAVIPDCSSLSVESFDALRREQVERSVFRIFSWTTGEFSFEVREQIEPRDLEILVPTGINPQYLTMEATRLGDEDGYAAAGTGAERAPAARPSADSDDAPLLFSGELEDASDLDAIAAAPAAPLADEEAPEPLPADAEPPEQRIANAALRREAPELESEVDPGRAPAAALGAPEQAAAPASEAALSRSAIAAAGLVAIDPRLSTLEWQKLNLAELFPRVHIFQHGESGIARIRQYLRRGEIPIALVSIEIARDRVSGVESLTEFIRRLKLLAPAMPVLIVSHEHAPRGESIDAADAILSTPDPAALANRKAWSRLTAEAARFRSEVAAWLKPAAKTGGSGGRSKASGAQASDGSESLRTLRAVSERIRDPKNQGEVLKLVLRFASESFSRVAIFMVRDEVVLGIAQHGLPRGGGPADAEFREIECAVEGVEWFRRVLETRVGLCAPVLGEGDRALARRLGVREPDEVYVAPIVSGGRVVALLYADNLPGGERIPDTSVIEIALHEAGLALERVLLQRALARVSEPLGS